MMRLWFGVAVVGAVMLLVAILAAALWIALLIAERSQRGEQQSGRLKMRRPFFLCGNGLFEKNWSGSRGEVR